MDVLSRVVGLREKNGLFIGKQTVLREAAEPWRQLEGTGYLDGGQEEQNMREEGGEIKLFPSVTLGCESPSFEFLTPRESKPLEEFCLHFHVHH